MAIDKKFWDGRRWNSHEAFRTVNHTHVCCYDPEPGKDSCDITVVETGDGRWYIEDSWSDAMNAPSVWNPYSLSDDEPVFFATEDAALRQAVSVVASITGVPVAELLPHYVETEPTIR